ncbi:MAG: ATP-binding protein [Clostridia bacterium]|nr:ATP-binding protein [Clostridia bacterium]
MKQIAFISGKGGTGKSTLVSSLSILVKDKMLADCDVEAANLHILLQGNLLEKNDYYGAKQAVINNSICMECGLCRKACRFDAISPDYQVMELKCEGCGACEVVCPVQAIHLEKVKTGETFVSQTERGIFSHALLDIGAEGSGRLVTEVRKNIAAYKKDEKWLLIDGSPGIGCVVIASITGTDAVVVVTEPTKTGLSDLERILKVAQHFKIPAFVCINKHDLNKDVTSQIEDYCDKNGCPVIGKIPFDPSIVEALREFKTPVEAGNEKITDEIINMWGRLVEYITKI